MEIIKRKTYLKKLDSFKDKNLIKVITGVRRCGKSTLLRAYRNELLRSGIPKKQIHFINFEDPDYSYKADWHAIYEDLNSSLAKGAMNYIFLDEVQYIPDFERLLIGLQTKPNVDLYVTGSNAHMLSSELATLLSGRSVEISMLPLSFSEYLLARKDYKSLSLDKLFTEYLSMGGFPQVVNIGAGGEEASMYLNGLYETVVGRDIMDRGEVKDKPMLNTITRFLLDNIGNPTSVNNISDELDVSDKKVEQILNALTASFLFYKLDRFDVKGNKLLKTHGKYYVVDPGLRWAMLGRNASIDKGHLLENMVYLELLRRGSKVSIGKVGDSEVDFVVRDTSGYTAYYQVAWTINSEKTLERELAPLKNIKDYSPRYIITMDTGEEAIDGIKRVNAIDWLLENTPLG